MCFVIAGISFQPHLGSVSFFITTEVADDVASKKSVAQDLLSVASTGSPLSLRKRENNHLDLL